METPDSVNVRLLNIDSEPGHDALIACDKLTGTIVSANRHALLRFGLCLERLVGLSLDDLTLGADGDARDGSGCGAPIRWLAGADGPWCAQVSERASVGGTDVLFALIASESPACSAAELLGSEARLARRLTRFGGWLWDPVHNTVRPTSPRALDILCGEAAHRVFSGAEIEQLVVPADQALLRRACRRALAVGAHALDVRFRVNAAAGQVRHVRVIAECRRNAQGKPTLLAGLIEDITEQQHALEQIDSLLYRDSVTSLPNRAQFDKLFIERLTRRGAYPPHLGLLIIDLTRFRDVNFALSHSTGDDLLRMIAGRILTVLGPRDIVARVGTRFPVLLQDVDEAGALARAHAICGALETPFAIADIAYEIGAHIGIALTPSHATNFGTLLRMADIAVQQARESDHSVAVYSALHDTHTPGRLALIGEFRRAIGKREIKLYCQPKVKISTRQIVGVEVLARWLHPTLGLIPPDDFIPLIESTELIHLLTQYMLANAAQCALDWQGARIAVPLAVNLSTRDIATSDLSHYLRAWLSESKVDPATIELEVTESSLMRDPVAAIAELRTLNDMGFRLYIDDFGTGFSSLNYLTQIPVDVIKIDHSFTMKMVHDARSAAIVRSTIHMAHDLGMTVVAEGTADAAIWRALAKADCDEAQGYHIAAPMPAEQFPHWIAGSGFVMAATAA